MIEKGELLKAKILIVDDQPPNVLLLEKFLKSIGYTNLRSTTDSREAVPIYKEFQPDLLLLDLNMPHIDGFGVLAQLNTIEKDSYLSVLILTAQTDQESRLRSLGLGAKDYLSKPFDMVEVGIRIRNTLEVRLLMNKLEQSQRESERLLHNILPAKVAEELKRTGKYQPVKYNDVSVLFSDFAGFTSMCENLSARELLDELQYCFGFFDEVAEKHNLEKIKTIGDSYMCVGGIPVQTETHPADCVFAALEMRDFIDKRKSEKEASGGKYWSIRVGIHTGPVMAGVIGPKKFAYDIWGDTVVTASRMESSSTPGQVNISDTTFKRVIGRFVCDPRGMIEAKNKGKLEMFYVKGVRP